MTFNEFKVLVKGMKAVYTQPNFLPDADSVKIWYRLLQDMPYELANVAIQRHMATNKFPPTPAEIRQAAVQTVEAPQGWADGWEQFRRAVRRYGYYQQEEAMNSMDEITRKTVRRLGWKELCESENIMQDRANFRMAYEQEANRRRETAALPEGVRSAIESLRAKEVKELGGGDD